MSDATPFPALAGSIDAVMLILRLSARYGPLMFRHGNSADGTQPLCSPVGSIALDASDVKLGEIAGCEYWADATVFEQLKSGSLLLDVRVANSASPDAPALSDRFVLRRIDH